MTSENKPFPAAYESSSLSMKQEKPGQNQGRNNLLFVIASGHAMKHIFVAGLFVLMPEIKQTLGLSNSALGILGTSKSLAGGLANAPAGFIADRYRQYFSPILAGLFVFLAIFQIALSRATSLFDAAVYASVLSVIATAWHPPAIGALSHAFPERRGLAISVHGTGASIGEALGPLLAGSLLLTLTWQSVLQFSAVPALVFALFVWLTTRKFKTDSDTASLQDYISHSKNLLKNRQLLLILLIAGAFGGCQAAMFVFLPVYLREDLGKSTFVVGLWIAFSQGIGVITQPIMGYLLDKIGRRPVIVPALFALSVSLIVLYFTKDGVLFLLCLGLAGAFLFSTTSLLVTAAVDVAGNEVQATTVSLVYSALSIFTALGPLAAGFLADEVSVRSVFLLAASLALLASILSLLSKMDFDSHKNSSIEQ